MFNNKRIQELEERVSHLEIKTEILESYAKSKLPYKKGDVIKFTARDYEFNEHETRDTIIDISIEMYGVMYITLKNHCVYERDIIKKLTCK